MKSSRILRVLTLVLAVVFVLGLADLMAAKKDKGSKGGLLGKYKAAELTADQKKKIEDSKAYKAAAEMDKKWSAIKDKKSPEGEALKKERQKLNKALAAEVNKNLTAEQKKKMDEAKANRKKGGKSKDDKKKKK